MAMTVLFLGAGAAADASEPPVWIAEHGGGLLVERFVEACVGLEARLVFAVSAGDIRRFHIDDIIRLAAPGARVVPIAGQTLGAACTALFCIEEIEPEGELLLLNSNEILEVDYAEPVRDFRARKLDAGAVIFPSLHPRYSYVRLDEDGFIEETAEKRPISRNAMAGFTWFRRGADFIAAARDMIAKDAHFDGRFYISLVFNELVLRQRRMRTYAIDAKQYRPLKSRRQIDLYEAEAGAGG
jgi:hypothetical protein